MDIRSNDDNGKIRRKNENWKYLNQETAESILRRLSFREFYNFGLVCSSWHSLLANAVTNKHCYPIPQIPLLLLCPTTCHENKVPCFFEVDKETTLSFENNIYPKNLAVLGTVNSWLIVSESTVTTTRTATRSLIPPNGIDTKYDYSVNLFFFNPMSRARVMLPSLMNDDDDGCHIPKVTKMVATSAPYDNCSDDEPVFVAGLTCCGIIFCKLTDKCWKSIGRDTKFTDMVMRRKLLYVLVSKTGYHHVIEVYNLHDLDKYNQRDHHSVAPPKVEILVALSFKNIEDILRVEYDSIVYVAHDALFGDIIKVENNMSRGFRVFKLNRGQRRWKNDVVVCEWVEVSDLGDRLIFVDQKSCRVISTVGLDEKDVPRRRNCIYFALNKFNKAGGFWYIDLGMFCLSCSSFHHFGKSESESVLKDFANSVWLMP